MVTNQRSIFAPLDPHNVAVGWLFMHGHALGHREALAGCVAHLMRNNMPRERAEAVAMQAYGEIASVNQPAHIDVDLTTTHMTVLRTRCGRTVMLTAADLLAAVEHADREGRCTTVNAATGRPAA